RVLQFDGSNDNMRSSSSSARSILRAVNAAYFFGVGRADDGSTGPLLWFSRGTTTASRADLRAGIIGGRRTDGDNYAQASAAVTSDWVMLLGVLDFQDRELAFYRDGELLDQTTGAWSGGGFTSDTLSQDVVLGAFDSLSTAFKGRIAE